MKTLTSALILALAVGSPSLAKPHHPKRCFDKAHHVVPCKKKPLTTIVPFVGGVIAGAGAAVVLDRDEPPPPREHNWPDPLPRSSG